MRSKTVLLSPEGVPITTQNFNQKIADTPDAWTLDKYKNDKVMLVLSAVQRIHTDGTVPPEHWMRFKVDTFNILKDDFEGRLYDGPKMVQDTDGSGQYRTLDEAKFAYQAFLAKYTESKFDGTTGKLKVRGNQLAPPDPDVPKVVESNKASASDFGSW